jgi:hypothetical protein
VTTTSGMPNDDLNLSETTNLNCLHHDTQPASETNRS